MLSERAQHMQGNDDTRGARLARRVLSMVALLHGRGIESLYLYCGMSPSGTHWRYTIGAMDRGAWPRRHGDPLQFFSSLSGSDDSGQLPWAHLDDEPEMLAEKFATAYPQIVAAARVPNSAYVMWFRNLLAASEPLALPVFYHDYKTDPRPEFWGRAQGVLLDIPPGLRPDA